MTDTENNGAGRSHPLLTGEWMMGVSAQLAALTALIEALVEAERCRSAADVLTEEEAARYAMLKAENDWREGRPVPKPDWLPSYATRIRVPTLPSIPEDGAHPDRGAS